MDNSIKLHKVPAAFILTALIFLFIPKYSCVIPLQLYEHILLLKFTLSPTGPWGPTVPGSPRGPLLPSSPGGPMGP